MQPVKIGNSTLYQGDCLEILQSLPVVDIVLTDPPYGIGENAKRVASRGTSSALIKRAVVTDYGDFDWDAEPASAAHIDACIAAGRNAVIWGGNYFQVPPARGWLVWDKINSGDFADCELAWTNLKMAVRQFRHMWNGMMRDSERTQRVHPTQKPVKLMEWCLSFAPGAETVLDAFMGSGTTGIACVNMSRSFIGIEKEPRYFDIACGRIEAAYAQGRLFV